MRAWVAAMGLLACTGGGPTPTSGPDPEAEALERTARLRSRIASELDCSGPQRSLLCSLEAVGEGTRPSWPSGTRQALPAIVFGIRPSRTLPRGLYDTADVVVGVVGDGGAALLGMDVSGDELRQQIVGLRRTLLTLLFPGEGAAVPSAADLQLPDALVSALEIDAVPLEALRPGERGWVGEDGVWFALPEQARPASWVRVDVHGEGTRLVVLLQPGDGSTAKPAAP